MQKIISFFLAIVMYLLPQLNLPKADVDPATFQSNYTKKQRKVQHKRSLLI